MLRRMRGYRVSSEVSRRISPTPETTRSDLFGLTSINEYLIQHFFLLSE